MADKIGIGSLISDVVHRPSVKLDSGRIVPLYARSESFNGQEDASFINDPKWIAACEKKYNSPNNIRRIIVGLNKVGVSYFVSPKGTDYGRFDTRKLHTPIEANREYTGQPFEFLSRYALSNIEEIYFDIGVIDVIGRCGKGVGFSNLAGFRQACQGSKEAGAMMLIKTISSAMGGSINDSIEDLIKKFPRIRAIAVMSQLDQCIDQYENDKGRDDVYSLWAGMERHKDKILTIAVGTRDFKFNEAWRFYDIGKERPVLMNENFSLRKGIYKFDDEVLFPYMDRYLAQLVVKKEKKEEKTELEKSIDKAENPAAVLKALSMLHGRDYIEHEIGKMTKAGKEKYSKLLG